MLRRLDDILMQGFSSEETEQLCGMLNRMRDNLLQDLTGEQGEETVAGTKWAGRRQGRAPDNGTWPTRKAPRLEPLTLSARGRWW